MSIRHRLLPLVVVAGLILGACSSSANPTSAPTNGPSSAPTSGASGAPPSAGPVTDGTLPKPELTSIKLGMTIGELSQFAPLLADYLGLYKKYGITVSTFKFNADGDVISAVLSGQVDMGSLGAAGAVNSQMTDTPLKVIEEQKVLVADGIFCNKNIKTAADMKGKSVGVSTLGGTGEASVLMALTALKMQPSDVVIQAVGGQSVRIAALKSGAIACAPIGMDQLPILQPLGFNVIIDLSKSGLQYPATGLAAQAAFLKKYPNTSLVMAAAILEAQNSMWTQPEATAGWWANYAQISNDAALQLVKTTVPAFMDRSMMWTDQAFEVTQQTMAVVTPSIMSVDYHNAFDRSFLQKLVDIGFYKKIGNPATN